MARMRLARVMAKNALQNPHMPPGKRRSRIPGNGAITGTDHGAPLLTSDGFTVLKLALRTVGLQKAAMNGHYIRNCLGI